VFIPEAVRPEPPRDRNDGRWLAVEEWPPDRSENAVMHLSHDGHLGPHAGEGGLRTVRSAQDSGTACGEFFPTRPNGEMSGDHRRDDADALVFTSDVLDEPLTLLGRPLIRLVVAIDAPVGTLVVRLNDLHPDGSSHRTSLGVLNLTHRLGNSEPQPMVPDRFERIEIALDEIGYRFMAGHRLQVAISTTYWPFVLPPPTAVTATLKTGGDAELVLPLLTAAVAYEMPLPDACADQPEFPQHTPERVQRWVERDLDGGATRYRIVDDSGLVEVPGHGLLMHETREETWSIRPDDPSTCEADIHWIARRRRGAWDTETRYSVTMTADRRFYHFASRIVALEAGTTVFSRSWRERIERQLL